MLCVNQVYIGGMVMLSLHNVMRANAMSCMVFGGLFALLPGQVAVFLGGASPAPRVYILALGVMLIINGIPCLGVQAGATEKAVDTVFFTGRLSLGDCLSWTHVAGRVDYQSCGRDCHQRCRSDGWSFWNSPAHGDQSGKCC